MYIYSACVYALCFAALALTLLSFMRMFGIFNASYSLRIMTIICAPLLALAPMPKHSFVSFMYGFFDAPSFSLLLVCALSVLRSVADNIAMTISYRGFLALFFIWLLFMGDAFGAFDILYGYAGHKILICGALIAIMYCADRLCAFILSISLALWAIFGRDMDVYNALFDSLFCVFGIFMQSIPAYKGNFHIALLKPNNKKG